jgi:glycosyltransferase involved in cell wall biosynthesis
VIPPGYWLHGFEWITYFLGIRALVDRIRREFPFDLIHAHFTYPDGYVATHLGRRYGVPVVITEHAPWRPWMDRYPRVRRQAVWASKHCAFHFAVSNALRDMIAHFAGESQRLQVVPGGVDGSVFKVADDRPSYIPNQILFVGIMRPVKGVDILLKAMRLLMDRGRRVRLVLVGEGFYDSYRREYERLHEMVAHLGLTQHVEFAGAKRGVELVQYMQQSALLVLPSRRESLGMVLVEALACGTPVVATRCGGPEDIVTDAVGILVPPEDPEALAQGIEQVLERRSAYDPRALRAYALDKFRLETVTARVVDLYRQAVLDHRKRPHERSTTQLT